MDKWSEGGILPNLLNRNWHVERIPHPLRVCPKVSPWFSIQCTVSRRNLKEFQGVKTQESSICVPIRPPTITKAGIIDWKVGSIPTTFAGWIFYEKWHFWPSISKIDVDGELKKLVRKRINWLFLPKIEKLDQIFCIIGQNINFSVHHRLKKTWPHQSNFKAILMHKSSEVIFCSNFNNFVTGEKNLDKSKQKSACNWCYFILCCIGLV